MYQNTSSLRFSRKIPNVMGLWGGWVGNRFRMITSMMAEKIRYSLPDMGLKNVELYLPEQLRNDVPVSCSCTNIPPCPSFSRDGANRVNGGGGVGLAARHGGRAKMLL